MAEILNCRGLKCPQPILKVSIKASRMPAGSTLQVHADCPSFLKDIEAWCAKTGRVLVSCVEHDGYNEAVIQF